MSDLDDIDECVDEEVVLDLARKTLRGDLRDFLLDRLKHMQGKRPWDEQSEAQQRDTIEAAFDAADHAIQEVARILIAEGRHVVHVALEQVVVKDGIKAVVSCPKTMDAMSHLGAAQGSTVAIVFASTDAVLGERAPRRAKPDQGDLLEAQADAAAAFPETPHDPETGEVIDPKPPPGTIGGAEIVGDDAPGEPATGEASSDGEPPDGGALASTGGPQDEPEVTEVKKRRGRPPKAKS